MDDETTTAAETDEPRDEAPDQPAPEELDQDPAYSPQDPDAKRIKGG